MLSQQSTDSTSIWLQKRTLRRPRKKFVQRTDKPIYRIHDRLRFCKELDSYLDEPNAREKSNPLIWWRTNQSKYPSLAAVARAYLIGHPMQQLTSVVSERVFSKCGPWTRLLGKTFTA
jgi:hAT family C-terminal dimerisation region